ncbi:MAG: CaiB/BaiF CoA transferase family protein [Myxococcota bacterium]
MNGIHILDLTRVLAGPWAVQHLADQGAHVIKVEPPGGDETRHFGPIINGHSTYFQCANRNKRSIVLDLKTTGGCQVLERLIERADVLVENFRPGVMQRLGFGWERLHNAHKRLLYVAIHAFGEDISGWSTRPGYDLLLQHMGGATAMTGFPGNPPIKHANSNADLIAGLYANQAILHGLLQRERTGETQKIIVNMMQAQASCLAYHATRWSVTGIVGQQRGNSHAGIVPYDVFRCADGWFVVACANDASWGRLCTALKLPPVAGWAKNVDRVANRDAVNETVQTTLATLSVSEAEAALTAFGVAGGPVLSPDQTLTHPAVNTVEFDHEALGVVRTPGPVLRTTSTREDHTPPPSLGEHRDSVLIEAGYSPSQIAELDRSGAFGAPV